jgi:hypothetical protein
MNATLRLAERSVELWGAVKCFNDIAAPLHAHVDRVAEVGASATLQVMVEPAFDNRTWGLLTPIRVHNDRMFAPMALQARLLIVNPNRLMP